MKRFCSVFLSVACICLGCSNHPSRSAIEQSVREQIQMEGGSEIHFDVFQVETLHEDNKKNSIAVKVRIAGNYRQNPHLYFDKRYRFDTRREYEFFMVSEGQWRPFVKSMRRLFEEEGSTEIFQ